MNDTSIKVKKLHLKIWLSKTPAERLLLTLKSNEELYLSWKNAKATIKHKSEHRKEH